MPTSATVVTGRVWADDPATCLGRILSPAGDYLVQSDVTSATWTVYDLDDAKAVEGTGSLTVSSVIFDTLQTDDIWTEDTTGYNFKSTISGTYLPDAGHNYRIVFAFVTSSGTFHVPFEAYAADVTG